MSDRSNSQPSPEKARHDMRTRAEAGSTISSVTRELLEGDAATADASSLSLHVPSDDPSGRRHSSESELRFSRRSTDVSDETSLYRTLTPSEFSASKRHMEQILPVSKLRFSSLGLVGRDEEKKLLETCLKRVTPPTVAAAAAEGNHATSNSTGSRELVLISGDAGTGKTALARTLMKPVHNLHGLYVMGKFDIFLRDAEPYSGIAAACREICGRILLLRGRKDTGSKDAGAFEKISKELLDKLGSENLHILLNVIPELSEIVGNQVIVENAVKQTSEETKARFNYAFRIFFRVVARNFSPLVILLDDIQWSDAATLDLLSVLIADRANPSLMLIGTYRSNEVDQDHPLSPLVRKLNRTAEQDNCFNITEIKICNLSVSQTNEIIMRLLSVDEPTETEGLADVCYKRSYGNVLSLIVFLEMLQREGLIELNLVTLKWSWDEQRIFIETAATATVVDLMKQKIEKLPTSVGQRLSIAACLGCSFEPEVLNMVWDTVSLQKRGRGDQKDPSGEEDQNDNWISLVEQEGFLEVEQDGNTYRWVHDKVQEAAMSLLPSGELPSLKAQVATILINELDEKSVDSYVFSVVNLLREGRIPEDEEERVQLSRLSLVASKKASSASAFESAGKYAAIGVDALPANAWSSYYSLTLDLYSTAAEAACYLGNTEELDKCYNEVLDQTERPLFDKLRVYRAMISYLGGALGRPSDAVELTVEILAHFGIRFPKRKASRWASTVYGLLKAKRSMAALHSDDITKMPTMDDPLHLEMMHLLDQLFVSAYLAKSDLMPLSIFASTHLTLENGLSEYSAPTFAGLAVLLGAALGDVKLASRIGGFAQVAMSKEESRNMDSRAELWLYAFVFVWNEPIERMTSKLFKSYKSGLSVGDNENACWCIAQYIVINFQSGKPLGMVETDCKIYLEQMVEFKRETVHADICIYLETVQNLMHPSEDDPTVMKSELRFLSHSDHTVLGVFYSCQCFLYLYFGEFEKGAKLAIKRGNAYSKGVPGHCWIMIETFVRGMCLYAMARKTKKRVYRKQARTVHRTIKAWIRKGNPNVKHYDLLFNAELAALKGKLDAAEGWYQSAIVSATRCGRIHESALSSERYGEFLLNVRKDPEEARHKFDDAIRRYSEWGAAKKVLMLRELHQDLWRRPSQVEFSSSRT